jgi:hypothetical protein
MCYTHQGQRWGMRQTTRGISNTSTTNPDNNAISTTPSNIMTRTFLAASCNILRSDPHNDSGTEASPSNVILKDTALTSPRISVSVAIALLIQGYPRSQVLSLNPISCFNSAPHTFFLISPPYGLHSQKGGRNQKSKSSV